MNSSEEKSTTCYIKYPWNQCSALFLCMWAYVSHVYTSNNNLFRFHLFASFQFEQVSNFNNISLLLPLLCIMNYIIFMNICIKTLHNNDNNVDDFDIIQIYIFIFTCICVCVWVCDPIIVIYRTVHNLSGVFISCTHI